MEDDVNKRIALDGLNRVVESESPEVLYYLDLKNGTKFKKILDYSNSSVESRYWRGKYNVLISCCNIVKDCIDSETCREEDACSCVVNHALVGESGNLMQRIVYYAKRMTSHKLSEKVGDLTKELWEEIGLEIVSWCCGSNPYSV